MVVVSSTLGPALYLLLMPAQKSDTDSPKRATPAAAKASTTGSLKSFL